MPKLPFAHPPEILNLELLDAVKGILRALPEKGTQTPELSSTDLESQLKEQGITVARGADLKNVLDKLQQEGWITVDSKRIGNWYVGWVNPDR